MARTLTTPGPLDTLEEAFDLLQRAPAPVWLRYLGGAAPLIVGLLFVLNEFSGANPAASPASPMPGSLVLVALLIWFYRCRQMFAGHLRRILSLTEGSVGPAVSPAIACFEGTRLLAIPLAALSILPLAWAVAFYRSLTLFAAEGLSARDATAKAWRAGLAWQRENWLCLAILNLLGLAVLVDVALTVVIAPTLVKIFTGYESVITQRGIDFPLILALTWLCFDPLLQAVYTVRAFKWEGLRTGEDLLVRLKHLAPLLIILAATCSTGFSLSRDSLNQSIDQTLQSPNYNWRIPPSTSDAGKKDWFIDTVDRTVALIEKGWKAITDFWSDLRDWIARMLRDTMPVIDQSRPGQPSAVRPIFYLIGVAIIALAIVLLFKFGPRGKKTTPGPVPAAAARTVDLTDEGLLASDLPEDEWLRLAERYASSGDLRLALRALYLGTLALLDRRGLLTIHACKSNRDYEGEIRRRSRDTGLTGIFRLNIRSFEQSWYGFHEVTADQLQSFRDNLGRMHSHEA